jgi:hypothetical protein
MIDSPATVAAVGAGLAWLGAALVLLSQARRGLALGLWVCAAGLSLLAWAGGRTGVAVVLLLAGLATSLLRLRDGRRGWGVLPTGSTPQLLLCLAILLVGVTLARPSLNPAFLALLTTLAVGCLGALRLLTAGSSAVALSAAAILALGLAEMGSWTVALAALVVAVATGTIPARSEA